MYVVSYLKQGLGNKIFLFATAVYFYLELRKKNKAFTKLYIAESKSKHQGDNPEERFDNLFPEITKFEWVEFISFKKFDELKKNCLYIDQNKMKGIPYASLRNIFFDTNYNFSRVPFDEYNNLLTKMFQGIPFPINRKDNDLFQSQYNFDEDIFLHMRYGDKLELVASGKTQVGVLTPGYYFDALNKFPKSSGPRNVYIFTDSIDLIKKVYMPDFRRMKDFNFIISDEPYWNVFHLAKFFKNIILSESTLVYAGILLNKNYTKIIAFPYIVIPRDFRKKELSDWPNKIPVKEIVYKNTILRENRLLNKDFILLDDKSYLLTKDFFNGVKGNVIYI
jgi:hypothetical protein